MSAELAWVLAAVAAAIIEMMSPLFGFAFVSIAALVAAAVAALGGGLMLQLLVFSATLALMLVFVRPRLVGSLDAAGVPSRTEALVGKIGRVTEAIDPVLGSGRVIVAGEDWAARCTVAVPLGAEVRIEGAESITLNVVPMAASAGAQKGV